VADMLGDGSSWLADRLAESAATTCAYKRGANTTTFTATVGRSTFESVSQSGVAESWESRDYIVKTAALPYGEPQRGDLIVEERNGVSRFYEVAAPRGVPLFHYADAYQLLVRIHTKQTDRDVTFIVDEQGFEISVPLITAEE
jgi:hypothetical protein